MATLNDWLKHIGRFGVRAAYIYMHLNGSQFVRYYPKTEEERELLQSELDLLDAQLAIFDQAINQLPDKEREACEQRYRRTGGNVDKEALKKGRTLIVFALKHMNLTVLSTNWECPVFLRPGDKPFYGKGKAV